MSNKVHGEDSVEVEFDDDLVELNTTKDASLSIHRMTSEVWNYFDAILCEGEFFYL